MYIPSHAFITRFLFYIYSYIIYNKHIGYGQVRCSMRSYCVCVYIIRLNIRIKHEDGTNESCQEKICGTIGL